jgi:SlyX protein
MNPTSKELSDRLNDLESRFAFQDEVIGVINPQVAGQDKRIASVEQELRALRQELAALRIALSHDSGTEAPPPHF